MMSVNVQFISFFLSILALGVQSEPQLYDFTKADSKHPELRRYPSAHQVDHLDYFRLLEVDGDNIVIGAADSVHNISIEQFERQSLYDWKPEASTVSDCAMKTSDSNSCRNFVRVLSRDERNGHMLICGTNAYQPLCRVVDHVTQKVFLEFSGLGISPMDPTHNTTFYREDDFLYSATVADFAGADSLIFRKNISAPNDRGLRSQRKMLNKPQFVGALHSEKFVYFFFREEASEASESATYSRVARVCKNDKGGPSPYETEWTTFAKIRVTCGIPQGNRQFYFDEIISISNITKQKGRSIVYATFVSEFNFLRHSVVCAFDLNQIDELFATSDYLAFESEKRKWIRKQRKDIDRTTKIGQCQNDSRDLSEDDMIARRQFPILADSVPNVFGRAVGIHRGGDHYNQIVVLEGVQTQEGQVDVLYVGTDQGNVFKIVNLAHASGWNSTNEEDPMHQVSIFRLSNLPIRRLLIAKNRWLIVVTDSMVFRLPLHFCSSYSTCDDCIQARDPHCVWYHGECTNVKDVKQKFAYQDVLEKRSKICDEARIVEKPFLTRKPKISSSKAKDVPLLLNDSISSSPGSTNCNCDLERRHEFRTKCNCTVTEEQRKAHITASVDSSPIIANEVESQSAGYGYAPWIAFGLLILVTQTVIMLVICYRNRNKKSRRKKPNVTIQMPKTSVHSVINAFGPTDTFSEKSTLPPVHGTLRRGPLGEISIHLDGSTVPSIHY
ncbi:Sema domain-containing protein [Aphelenchoides besseyi]|nr:Sema domain-containing protein [Aphelenchoides besseyi]KAI6208467.1 Sema domain-containing protein [Aphelenchoides besseyi]